MGERSTSSYVGGCSVVGVILLFLSTGVWLTLQIEDHSHKRVVWGAVLFCSGCWLGVIIWQTFNSLWEQRFWSGLFVFLPSVVVQQVFVAWFLSGFSTAPPFREAAWSFGTVGLIFAIGIFVLDQMGIWKLSVPYDGP